MYSTRPDAPSGAAALPAPSAMSNGAPADEAAAGPAPARASVSGSKRRSAFRGSSPGANGGDMASLLAALASEGGRRTTHQNAHGRASVTAGGPLVSVEKAETQAPFAAALPEAEQALRAQETQQQTQPRPESPAQQRHEQVAQPPPPPASQPPSPVVEASPAATAPDVVPNEVSAVDGAASDPQPPLPAELAVAAVAAPVIAPSVPTQAPATIAPSDQPTVPQIAAVGAAEASVGAEPTEAAAAGPLAAAAAAQHDDAEAAAAATARALRTTASSAYSSGDDSGAPIASHAVAPPPPPSSAQLALSPDAVRRALWKPARVSPFLHVGGADGGGASGVRVAAAGNWAGVGSHEKQQQLAALAPSPKRVPDNPTAAQRGAAPVAAAAADAAGRPVRLRVQGHGASTPNSTALRRAQAQPSPHGASPQPAPHNVDQELVPPVPAPASRGSNAFLHFPSAPASPAVSRASPAPAAHAFSPSSSSPSPAGPSALARTAVPSSGTEGGAHALRLSAPPAVVLGTSLSRSAPSLAAARAEQTEGVALPVHAPSPPPPRGRGHTGLEPRGGRAGGVVGGGGGGGNGLRTVQLTLGVLPSLSPRRGVPADALDAHAARSRAPPRGSAPQQRHRPHRSDEGVAAFAEQQRQELRAGLPGVRGATKDPTLVWIAGQRRRRESIAQLAERLVVDNADSAAAGAAAVGAAAAAAATNTPVEAARARLAALTADSAALLQVGRTQQALLQPLPTAPSPRPAVDPAAVAAAAAAAAGDHRATGGGHGDGARGRQKGGGHPPVMLQAPSSPGIFKHTDGLGFAAKPVGLSSIGDRQQLRRRNQQAAAEQAAAESAGGGGGGGGGPLQSGPLDDVEALQSALARAVRSTAAAAAAAPSSAVGVGRASGGDGVGVRTAAHEQTRGAPLPPAPLPQQQQQQPAVVPTVLARATAGEREKQRRRSDLAMGTGGPFGARGGL